MTFSANAPGFPRRRMTLRCFRFVRQGQWPPPVPGAWGGRGRGRVSQTRKKSVRVVTRRMSCRNGPAATTPSPMKFMNFFSRCTWAGSRASGVVLRLPEFRDAGQHFAAGGQRRGLRRAAAGGFGGRATDCESRRARSSGRAPRFRPGPPGPAPAPWTLPLASTGQASRRGGAGNQVVTDAGPVHLFDSPAMHGEQVNGMFGKKPQQFVKTLRRIETDPRFDREGNGDRVAQRAEDGVYLAGVAQEAAPGAFAVNHRGGAAQVQVNRGDGIAAAIRGRCGPGRGCRCRSSGR